MLEAGAKFERDALDLVIEHARGYPYLLQEWGYEAWNVAKRSPIDLRSVRRAAPLVRNKLDENFFLASYFLRINGSAEPCPQRSSAEFGSPQVLPEPGLLAQ